MGMTRRSSISAAPLPQRREWATEARGCTRMESLVEIDFTQGSFVGGFEAGGFEVGLELGAVGKRVEQRVGLGEAGAPVPAGDGGQAPGARRAGEIGNGGAAFL